MTVTLDASPDPVAAGDLLTYTLVAANEGPRDAPGSLAGLMVLPEGVAFAARAGAEAGTCSPPASDAPLLVTCEFGTTSPGFSASVEVTATVTAPPGSVLEALAGFGTSGIDADPSNSLARLSIPVVG